MSKHYHFKLNENFVITYLRLIRTMDPTLISLASERKDVLILKNE